MRKAISVIIFCLFFALSVTYCCNGMGVAYAENDEVGFDLGEYKVKISYHYHIQYSHGLYSSYEVIFDNDFYQTLENKPEVFFKLKDTFVKNGFELAIDQENGKMVAALSFSTIEDYYIWRGIDGYVVSEKMVPDKKTFFYTYYSSTSQTVFAKIKTEGNFANRIYQVIKTLGIKDEEIILNYVYGTPYDQRMISSNADEVKYSASEKMYYHIFKMNMDECEKEATLSQKVPNTTCWYLLAIGLALIVLAIPLTIVLRKRKEKKNG